MATELLTEVDPELGSPPGDVLWEFVNGQYLEKTAGASALELANVLMLEMSPAAAELGRVRVEMVFDFMAQIGHKRRPDLSYIAFEKWAKDRPLPDSDWVVVPNLAVEIVSPSNRYQELIEKKNEYFQVGVEEVWIVVPSAREISIYESGGDVRIVNGSAVLTAERLLPGFKMLLDDLFGPVPKAS